MVLILPTDDIDEGYESRCSVCNCEFRVEIEALREDNKTFEEIKHFANIKGVQISLMALSRHFSRHYPQRRLYLDHVKSKQAKIDSEVGLKIDDIFKIHPNMDRNYFEECSTFHRSMERGLEYLEKSNKEIFMEDHGFCHDCSQLCHVIPPKEAMYTEDVDKFYQNKNQEVATSIKFGCIECKIEIQEQMILALGKIVSILLPIQN